MHSGEAAPHLSHHDFELYRVLAAVGSYWKGNPHVWCKSPFCVVKYVLHAAWGLARGQLMRRYCRKHAGSGINRRVYFGTKVLKAIHM